MNESTVHIYSKKHDVKEDNNGVASTESCSTKATDERQRKEKSPTKSKLMSLANELFDFFLIYLSPCDIVQSLSGINKRLNLLIYHFIHRIDVSTKKKQWLNKHLLSIQPLVTRIKFDHSELQTLFPTTTIIHNQYHCLKSIIWNYQFGHDDRLSISYLNIFKIKLLSLNLNLNSDNDEIVDNNIALLLLQNDSLIENLIFKDNNSYNLLWFSFK
ncbi:unnamed protein product [Didymodactylos carnosus]|uniref:Uncharacterized protein n=1 Tax=Didymodactylos carnosus TaxID=1234261 RepID=A0A814ZMU9_9BILA|nr:unnamed protein product [Didymodactylos carnosus]CAF4011911.1 unnamed protein product [Didymodactylos carnosus]